MVRIRLVSKPPEAQVFNIDDKVARQSPILKYMMEKCTDNNENTDILTISVNVSVTVLEKVIQWADYRKNDPESSVVEKRFRDLCRWDIEFFEENRGILTQIAKASSLLKFEQLYSDASVFVSDVMRRKTDKELQEYFRMESFAERTV